MVNETQKIDLGGFNLKEWSLLILLAGLVIVFIVFAIGMAAAMSSGAVDVKFAGTIDLGQFTGVIIGIAIVATTLVAQQLTAKTQAKAVKDTDDAWLEDQRLAKKSGKEIPKKPGE